MPENNPIDGITLVVTRHSGLLEFFRQKGWLPEGVKVIAHARPEDVVGECVLGVLPHHLSSLADSVTEVKLDLPPELRGVELSAEQVAEHFRGVATYRVEQVPGGPAAISEEPGGEKYGRQVWSDTVNGWMTSRGIATWEDWRRQASGQRLTRITAGARGEIIVWEGLADEMPVSAPPRAG